MEKRELNRADKSPARGKFIPTEMGSARSVSLGGEGSFYKYEEGPTSLEQGMKGPPWGLEPSMKFVCDEVGVDVNSFIQGLQANKSDVEMAQELNVSEAAIRSLKDRFYSVEGITGNYGQD